eukprot:6213760-Pleurochrysis_carterae.AAC.2
MKVLLAVFYHLRPAVGWRVVPQDVGVDLLVGWPVSLRIGLGLIIALHVKVMLSGDGKYGAQRGVLDGGCEGVLKVATLLQA